MSQHQLGTSATYALPAQYDSVPQSFMSNKSPKPINCSLQTVNVPALSGNAAPLGTSIIQLATGANAGYMCNPYLRFNCAVFGTNVATSTINFKGSVAAASALINRYSTYLGSQQVDTISNADQVYDQMFAHSSSNDWLSRDASVLMGAGVTIDGNAIAASPDKAYVLPLLGLLGSQSAIPLFAFNGNIQIQIDWNSITRSFTSNVANSTITNFTISNVQLVYDRINVEQAFVDRVKMDMAQGNQYVIGYTNFQSTTLIPTPSATSSLNYGLNVSSLRAIVASQVLTAHLSDDDVNKQAYSVYNDLSQFIVSLDGRQLNSNVLNAVSAPAVVFAELNKCWSRLFDASITDACDAATFLTRYFMVGCSAARSNENLSFSGSPVSVLGLQTTVGASATTMFVTFISDMQLLIDATGSCTILR